jgi:hypothetical protein
MDASQRLAGVLTMGKEDSSWRTSPTYFNHRAKTKPGIITMSPAWFQQGHEVCVTSTLTVYTYTDDAVSLPGSP